MTDRPASPTVLLISTYELGRQPFGLASPVAWLRAAGARVRAVDASRDHPSEADVLAADAIGFFLPMHTATRLAVPLIRAVHRANPHARLCAYGIYAPPNAELLRELGVDAVFGGEFEQDLVDWAWARGHDAEPSGADSAVPHRGLPRLRFLLPDRDGLPPLSTYAALQMPDGQQRRVGYTEASRGCKHHCRHCPVVPIYNGQFRIVDADIVIADIRAQVDRGAQHITFGDPDFFNGVGHAMKIVQRLAEEWPDLTYDATIKVEHLLDHADRLTTLRDTGCVFVTTAAESVDDGVLTKLEKGHTRADFESVVGTCRSIGLPLAPTFVAFTPWTSIEGYCDLLDSIAELNLVDHVAPIQLAIRLLLPRGSRLLDVPDIATLVGVFEPETLMYRWAHPDVRVDRLHQEVLTIVGGRVNGSRRAVFDRVHELACSYAARNVTRRLLAADRPDRATVPYLTEPWYVLSGAYRRAGGSCVT